MKGLFGIAGLLLALAITGVLIRQQMTATKRSELPMLPGVAGEPEGAAMKAALPSAKNQTEQYRQALEAAMQSQRSMPDDKQ